MNPNPTCEKDCRFLQGPASTTCAYYTPVFDKRGNNLNPDGNTTSQTIKCLTCQKSWFAKTQYGNTEFEDLSK